MYELWLKDLITTAGLVVLALLTGYYYALYRAGVQGEMGSGDPRDSTGRNDDSQ